ncbi:uncharacterized protein LOC128930307 [Callithrix jacchus]|uniref:uncharacterized protein LOC128930307 n=1 Tax=Callithrix jacchus TaxID=9483 RepID=UPI0023DCF772|nr:uncharacterized protein LOC128930307 [Callithrix jacchus]
MAKADSSSARGSFRRGKPPCTKPFQSTAKDGGPHPSVPGIVQPRPCHPKQSLWACLCPQLMAAEWDDGNVGLGSGPSVLRLVAAWPAERRRQPPPEGRSETGAWKGNSCRKSSWRRRPAVPEGAPQVPPPQPWGLRLLPLEQGASYPERDPLLVTKKPPQPDPSFLIPCLPPGGTALPTLTVTGTQERVEGGRDGGSWHLSQAPAGCVAPQAPGVSEPVSSFKLPYVWTDCLRLSGHAAKLQESRCRLQRPHRCCHSRALADASAFGDASPFTSKSPAADPTITVTLPSSSQALSFPYQILNTPPHPTEPPRSLPRGRSVKIHVSRDVQQAGVQGRGAGEEEAGTEGGPEPDTLVGDCNWILPGSSGTHHERHAFEVHPQEGSGVFIHQLPRT